MLTAEIHSTACGPSATRAAKPPQSALEHLSALGLVRSTDDDRYVL